MSRVQGVTPCVKLVYLKSYLEGRALSLIENLPIVDNSYTTAWQIGNCLRRNTFTRIC